MKRRLIVFSYSQDIREAVRKIVRVMNLTFEPVSRWNDLTHLLDTGSGSLVMIDSNVQKRLGSRAYKDVYALSPKSKIILIRTPPHTDDTVKKAMAAGAFACLGWPLNKWEMSTLIEYVFRDID